MAILSGLYDLRKAGWNYFAVRQETVQDCAANWSKYLTVIADNHYILSHGFAGTWKMNETLLIQDPFFVIIMIERELSSLSLH